MELRVQLTRKRAAILVVLVAAIGAGVAYAAIPDGNGVYTACMLKNVGTIRIIDPSTQRCSASLETQITFNAKGPKGDPGINGTNGTNGTNGRDGADGTDGTDGTDVTSAPEPAGENCANGGTRFSSASGTSYACNGTDGTGGGNGAPWHIIQNTMGVLSPGTTTVNVIPCPTGETILGGTFDQVSSGTFTSQMEASFPNAWRYTASNNTSNAIGPITMHTYCGTS